MITVQSNSGLENFMKAVIAKFPKATLIKVGAGSDDPIIRQYTLDFIFEEWRPDHKDMLPPDIKDAKKRPLYYAMK